MAHRVTVAPARAREWNAELGCNVLRGFGYRARCSCKWSGPVRPSMREARADSSAHRSGGAESARP